MKQQKSRFVFVIWEDTVHRGGWREPSEVPEMVKDEFLVGSTGFLVTKNKKKVVLSQGRACESGDWQDLLVIPTHNVKQILKMKVCYGKTRAKNRKNTHR